MTYSLVLIWKCRRPTWDGRRRFFLGYCSHKGKHTPPATKIIAGLYRRYACEVDLSSTSRALRWFFRSAGDKDILSLVLIWRRHTCDIATGTCLGYWDTRKIPLSPALRKKPLKCLRSWTQVNFAGMPAVKTCDNLCCRRRMFSYGGTVSQAVPAARLRVGRRNMRTKLYENSISQAVPAARSRVGRRGGIWEPGLIIW